MTEEEQARYRSRRSDDEDDEDVRTDTNLLSNIGRLIVRRDAGKREDDHKEKKDSPEIKRKDERMSKESHHLSKKHGLQAEKHHAKKGTTNKKVQDKKKALKAKRVSKQQDKKSKRKANSDELSKENLVKALIAGDARAKDHKEQTGVPEKAYRALVEFMAGSEQPTIETGSKKSDIAKPQASGGKGHPRSSKAKQGVRRKLTKKRKRVLAILSKMPQSVLRKYFHLKGLDKYWKVMDNIRRKQAAKEIAKKKLKTHKDERIVKELKALAPKKAKTSTHFEKKRLLQKQAKSHQKISKQTVSSHKVIKDKEAEKTVKDETKMMTGKVKTAEKIVKDKTKEKSKKPTALHSPSSQKSAKNGAKQTQIEPAHLKKDQDNKTAMEQHAKVVVIPQKDFPKNLPKEVKRKDFNKREDKIEKNDAGKSAETSKVAPHIKEATSTKKAVEKLKSHVQDLSKKEAEKKVSLKPAAAEQTAPTKDSKEKSLNSKDKPAKGVKVVKVNARQLKSPASVQALKTSAKLQAAENKDLHTHEIKMTKEKPEVHVQTESLQYQLKAMAPNVTKKVINQNSSAVANDKPKEILKAPLLTEHHEVKAAHAPQKPEVKQGKDSQIKQQSPGASKIDILKEKIQKTNTLKFKVAQALLAHCETQNRLRQVFDEVNSSLKKAASLAKAIGAKFGIKPSDVEKMTSEHTEGAVEQFLNKLF